MQDLAISRRIVAHTVSWNPPNETGYYFTPNPRRLRLIVTSFASEYVVGTDPANPYGSAIAVCRANVAEQYLVLRVEDYGQLLTGSLVVWMRNNATVGGCISELTADGPLDVAVQKERL